MALGFMRRHRRWLYVFLWLVIGAFIILYIPAFQGASAGSPGEVLARVGGLTITVGEFQKTYLQARQMYERMYQGQGLDAATLQSLGLQERVFESLVADRVVRLEARRLGLAVDDQSLAHYVATDPQFQRNGRFVGAAEIRRAQELQGSTMEDFEDRVRQGLLRDKLEAIVADGVAVSPAEIEREFRRRTEQIKVEYVLVDSARFRSQVQVGDAELQSAFAAKKETYRIPEKRVLSYILVDQEALKTRITVTDRDLDAYYQEHQREFKEDEQVCASHILVKVKQSPDAKEGHADDEAKKLAQALLAQVQAGGDFAAIAKKSSEDKGSAPTGGDLGCSPHGRWVQEFDNAAFGLDPGKTSDLVKSPFGYHIIHVSSRKEETTPPLSVVKERIRQTLVAQKGRALADEKSGAIADVLGRGRGLDEAAKGQGLTVQKSAPMAASDTVDPLNSPTLLARAFEIKAAEVVPEAFRVARGYAFIALAEIQPTRLPEFKEAAERVRSDVSNGKALDLAKSMAAEVKAKAEKVGLEKAAAASGLVRKETPTLVGRGQPLGDLGASAGLDAATYALPEKSVSDPIPAAGGYALVRVLEKKAFDPVTFEKQKDAIAASMRDERRSQLFQAYLTQAKGRFPVERRPEAFKRVLG